MESEEKPAAKAGPNRSFIVLVIVVIALIIALTVGLVLHFELNNDDDDDKRTVERNAVIVDCFPELRRNREKMEKNEDDCKKRGCIWQRQQDAGAPWCVFPEDYGYKISQGPTDRSSGYRVELTRNSAPPPYDTEVFDQVIVDVEMQTDNRVRVKIYPKDRQRWEIPSQALNIEATNNGSTNEITALYNVTFSENPFGVQIIRSSTGAVVFNTSLPGMVIADQFLQVTTRLTNENLYGFGEHRHETIRHDMNWRTWSMFTRDSGPNSNWNLYGHHPVYLNVEDDLKANMVLLKNTNAMEVTLQPNPEPAVTFRTIGGVLDFYIFLGDSPADAVKQYIKAIGQPVFPPYWSFGYHLSRWGFVNITDMRDVIKRNRDAGIPYEAQWADIDTFHKAYVFTYSKQHWNDFPNLVKDLKSNKQHFITIVDPGIGANRTIINEVKADFPGWDIFDDGEKEGIFVRNATNATLIAEVWPGVTAFPDFTDDRVQAWWTKWIRFYLETIGVEVEALWIDMNEPASFVEGSVNGCERNKLNYPPYVPDVDGAWDDGKLYVKTLCMDGYQAWGRHYDVHSLYAHTMAQRTYKSLSDIFSGQRPWTMTRASYVGTGHYATKWQGDNRADWSNMHYSIISLMEFGMFGFPMNGADICGFWLEPSYEMCVRWHQLGAFYPFARNHNGRGDPPELFKHQDPAAFGQDFVDLVKPVLLTRYKFLPYLYTIMYRAHVEGEIVFKPLFFVFPEESETMEIDKQFMLGPAFLISPVMEEGARQVEAYFPQGRWFDYITGEEIRGSSSWKTLDTPLNKYNLHLRGGSVIPWQEPDVTTFASRQKPFGLLVALDNAGLAQGELFWDDGHSEISDSLRNYNIIKFEMEKTGELIIRREVISSGDQLQNLNTIEIYGLSRLPQNFKIDNNAVPNAQVTSFNNIVTLSQLNLPLTTRHTVTWSLF